MTIAAPVEMTWTLEDFGPETPGQFICT